ncbi:MAG TPA: DNRLRE domain-containing protein [Candidatus Omnitrophota bacterium]|nr:DNRLRE domain-containing protein [Candidatus Omnitrophota bacterium]
MQQLRLWVWLVCWCAVWTGQAQADQEYVFWPSEDAWVNDASPEVNYGNNTYMTVRDRSGLAEAYLKFSEADLGVLRGQTIKSASLFAYEYSGTNSPGDALNLHAVTQAWSESGITWNTRPAYEAVAVSSLGIGDPVEGWRQWKGIEPTLNAWAQGSANYGFVLENNLDAMNNELNARFYASEYTGRELRPYLKVTTTPEPVSMVLFGLGAGVLGVARRMKAG